MTATNDTTEADLVRRLQAGEAAAFDEVVRVYGGRLLNVARRFLANEEDARDAVQDAFLSAFRALASFDARSQLATWLHRIVVNAALARIRARKRRPERPIEDFLPTFIEDGHHRDPVHPWASAADVPLEQHETRALVRAAIDQLPESYKSVLLLRDIEQLDTDEAATALGVTVGVVKTRLHRARQALRTLLVPHFARGAV